VQAFINVNFYFQGVAYAQKKLSELEFWN
jgi:hypothetical protein